MQSLKLRIIQGRAKLNLESHTFALRIGSVGSEGINSNRGNDFVSYELTSNERTNYKLSNFNVPR